jgi:endonuclease YncB( thermonuclease family)
MTTPPAPAPTLYTYKVNQVLRVIDGDTMVVSKDDKYGRMLGDFICADTGATLAEAMIAASHATVYK